MIMDDNRIMEAAKLIANSSAALIQAIGMMSENIEQMIKLMVDNELKNKDFNVIPRMVEKVLKDKMLNDIEIVVINKNLND